jgi:predicted lipoprotein with Yx(FWY)xxD motif
MISNVPGRAAVRLLVLGMLALVAVAGGFSSSADARAGQQAVDGAQASATVTVRSTRFGRILFDGRGRALYAFTRDRRGGRSQCYGACAKAWPVYFAKGRLLAGKGVKQSLIGTTRRRDGRQQVTYNGRPLYYYVGDKSPGQVLCQNVKEFGGTWLVVRPNGQFVQ